MSEIRTAKTKDGRWAAVYMYERKDGRWQVAWVVGDTEDEARSAAVSHIADVSAAASL